MSKNSNNLCSSPQDTGGMVKLNINEEQSQVKELNELEKSNSAKQDEMDSYGKFNSAEALLKAYNGLEAEFTKRSQELKRLERELAELKAEETEGDKAEVNAVTSELADDETGIAKGEQPDNAVSAEEGYDEEDVSEAVARFLSKNPGASKYAEEIALKTSERRELDNGFLERAYIAVLEEIITKERNKINDDFIYTRAAESSTVKEKIIRDYLKEVMNSRGAKLLSYSGESGQSVVMPPKKPLSITEAGELATEVLKKGVSNKYN